jgi:glycosyltransferase involved in cell wall biosynthesis
MKVALVVPGGVDKSGEYRVIPALLALIGRLAKAHEVHVFALLQEPQAGSWEMLGAWIHNIGSGATRLRAIRAICAEHRRAPFQIIQSMWSGASGLVAVSAGKLLRRPALVHVAGGELVALREIAYGGRLSWKGRLREAVVLRFATAVTAASAPMTEALSKLGIRARRLPLGVDRQAWPPRAPVRRDGRKPARLIHVASLNRVKDQSTLLRALAALAESGLDFYADIVGEDTLHGEIQAMARTLGIADRTTFHGFLTQRRLRPIMEAADLMVVSSRHEAGPMAVLEAAFVGVPTVGTAVGHIAEWAPDAAVAAPIEDWAGLAAGIKQLLGDEDRRLRIAHQALERAMREDADHCAERLQAIYAQLAGS